MRYDRVLPATFLSRPNRFVAHIEVGGRAALCHVKNTGRCRELLLPGARIFVQAAPEAPARRTEYTLISVYKGERLINIDSAAPNRLFSEWVTAGGPGFVPDGLRPEVPWGNSRFDFLLRAGERTILAEVKGVTLEEDGLTLFPDAPTLRGLRHLRELTAAVRAGLDACAAFVVQMEGVRGFSPNDATHPAFGAALREAAAAGVVLHAFDCRVTPDEITPGGPVPLLL